MIADERTTTAPTTRSDVASMNVPRRSASQAATLRPPGRERSPAIEPASRLRIGPEPYDLEEVAVVVGPRPQVAARGHLVADLLGGEARQQLRVRRDEHPGRGRQQGPVLRRVLDPPGGQARLVREAR